MSDQITITEFSRVELLTGTIQSVDEVEGADKIIKLQVSVGEDSTRQIIAGIKQHVDTEQLPGTRVIVVANLKPARIRGELSQGMILAATSGDDLSLVTVTDDIADGARVQ